MTIKSSNFWSQKVYTLKKKKLYTLSFKNYLWIIRSKMSTSFRTLLHSCMWKKKVDWLHKKEIKTEKQTEDPESPVFILRLVWISKDFRLYENQSER